jgi:hypothetical protein
MTAFGFPERLGPRQIYRVRIFAQSAVLAVAASRPKAHGLGFWRPMRHLKEIDTQLIKPPVRARFPAEPLKHLTSRVPKKGSDGCWHQPKEDPANYLK